MEWDSVNGGQKGWRKRDAAIKKFWNFIIQGLSSVFNMDLSLFDYPFPKELVAQHPLSRRDDSRLLVLSRQSKSWEHRKFPDLVGFLKPGDLMILNNADADPVLLEGESVPPLPPYIKRKRLADFTQEDFERYRTVYASVPGSKAAPTAGFHFTEEILEKIRRLDIEIRSLTLHVGFDTFKPIRTPQIEEHPMHGESYEIPVETTEAILKAKQEKRRVIAVGTTVVRALESWAVSWPEGELPEGSEDLSERSEFRRSRKAIPPPAAKTQLLITPGFQFKVVDLLLTNFHRPRSTVLVLVSTFAGRELILSAYEDAIREKYRLFSYGDCMLII